MKGALYASGVYATAACLLVVVRHVVLAHGAENGAWAAALLPWDVECCAVADGPAPSLRDGGSSSGAAAAGAEMEVGAMRSVLCVSSDGRAALRWEAGTAVLLDDARAPISFPGVVCSVTGCRSQSLYFACLYYGEGGAAGRRPFIALIPPSTTEYRTLSLTAEHLPSDAAGEVDAGAAEPEPDCFLSGLWCARSTAVVALSTSGQASMLISVDLRGTGTEAVVKAFSMMPGTGRFPGSLKTAKAIAHRSSQQAAAAASAPKEKQMALQY